MNVQAEAGVGWVAALLAGGIGLVVVLAVAGTWWSLGGPMVPRAIPSAEQRLFLAAYGAARQDLIWAGWSVLSPGRQRYDARVYASTYVMVRDVYLPTYSWGLSREERAILAMAASVANLCEPCVQDQAVMLRAAQVANVDSFLLERRANALTDRRARALATLALKARQPAEVAELMQRWSLPERVDAASVLFTFNCLNRVIEVLDPLPEPLRPLYNAARTMAAPVFAGRGFEGGEGLRALGPAREMVANLVDGRDAEEIQRWTQGRPDASLSVMFVWSAIQTAAYELFDAEVLLAIRSHIEEWDGEEFPFTGDWQSSSSLGLSSDHHRMLVEFGVLVARCAHRVSPGAMLRACGDERSRLVLAAFSACAAALRCNEWLPITDDDAGPPGVGRA